MLTTNPRMKGKTFLFLFLFCVSMLLWNCVIDPQLLFPPQEKTTPTGDAATTTDTADPKKNCYDECTLKGTDADKCKAICYPEKDPTKDCYQPCLAQGGDTATCRKKCYQSSDPITDCLLGCVKQGYLYKDCEPASQSFAECLERKDNKSCLPLCTPITEQTCSQQCLKKNIPAADCKKRVMAFTDCRKMGKKAEECQILCTG